MAAEAGLIVPEPDKQSANNSDVTGDSVLVSDSPNSSPIIISEHADASEGGLMGGSTLFKLSLKGGLSCPPKGYRYRKLGLKGGSKDEDNAKSPTTTAEADSTQSVNGLAKQKDEEPGDEGK